MLISEEHTKHLHSTYVTVYAVRTAARTQIPLLPLLQCRQWVCDQMNVCKNAAFWQKMSKRSE